MLVLSRRPLEWIRFTTASGEVIRGGRVELGIECDRGTNVRREELAAAAPHTPEGARMNYLEAAAEISPCGLYRYTLTRLWHPDRDTVVFAMLNPSTADGTQDDPTIRRCVGFADAWGYGRLVVVNLFALRATDPTALRGAADPVGPLNDGHLFEHTAGRVTICAWGNTVARWRSPRLNDRPAVARRVMQGALLRHLGLTKDGHPLHPLYRPADSQPLPFDAKVPT